MEENTQLEIVDWTDKSQIFEGEQGVSHLNLFPVPSQLGIWFGDFGDLGQSLLTHIA